MDFTSCFLCSSTKNVEKTCFILFSLDGVRAIVYNKNSDNKTPCKRSGCGLIKSLLFYFFINDYHSFCCLLSFVLYFVFARSCLGNGSFFTLFEKTQKTKSPVHPVRWRRRFFYMFIVRESFSTADCPQLVRQVQRLSGIGENPVFEKRTKNNLR